VIALFLRVSLGTIAAPLLWWFAIVPLGMWLLVRLTDARGW